MEDEDERETAVDGPWLEPTTALSFCDPPEDSGRRTANTQEEPVRYGFRVGSLGLMVARETQSEIVGRLPVYPVPNTPGWFPGLVNLRGNLIPTFHLKRLLDLPEDQEQDERLLVLDKGHAAAGVFIDGFPKPLRLLEPLARTPRLPKRLEEHVTRVFVMQDLVWLELDHRDFFRTLGQLMKIDVRAA